MVRSTVRRLVRPIVAGLILAAAYGGISVFAPTLFTIEKSGEHLRLAFLLMGAAVTTWLCSRVAQVAVATVMIHKGKKPSRLLLQLITIVFFIIASSTLLIVLSDGALTGALATSGVAFAIIGFALRSTISDIFSGIALSVEGPYRIGDWIEIEAGVLGRVVEINWRATRIETRDQVHVVVPNGRIAEGRLTNYSAPRPYYRSQIAITLDYEIPIPRAKQILLAAVSSAVHIRMSPSPDVKVRGYGERGIEYAVRYWIPNFGNELDCRDAVLENIDRFLRMSGVHIPSRNRVLIETGSEPGKSVSLAPELALASLPQFKEVPLAGC